MQRRKLVGLITIGAVGGLLGCAFGGILPLDPDFCEKKCPICTRARKGDRLARAIQSFEMFVTRGGCPWGRARQRKYGVRPDQPLPAEVLSVAKRDQVDRHDGAQ